jgi:hypothetical protein
VRPTSTVPLLALLALVAGCVSEPEPEPEPDPTPAPVAGPLSDEVALTLVTLNQGVAVPLVSEGAAVNERNAPIIAGREGVLRVFVTPDEGFEPRPLVAELVLYNGQDDPPTVLRETVAIASASLSASLESTFNFVLSPELITPDTRFSVAVREADGLPRPSTDGAAWPPADGASPSEALDGAYALGHEDLAASAWGGTVRVYIIPVRYDSDGSGRLPDTSESQLERLRDTMRRFYPLRAIELEVGEPYATELPFDSTSDPMSDLLEEVIAIRRARGVPFDTYAYAMVNPAPSREQYCSSGCTSGIAYRVGNPNADHLRSGVGLGYSDENTAETMAHEVGHNHDRGHAPCGGAGNTDPDYPYPNGSIGVWGWDPITGELKDPADHRDVMGYCTPRWVSDYEYDALWRRMAAVEGLADRRELKEEAWQIVAVRPGDRSRIKAATLLTTPPDGDAWTVALRDGDGRELGEVTGHLQRIEDAGPGVGTLLLPALAPEVGALVLPDGRIVLR